jgi:hypothetical protein
MKKILLGTILLASLTFAAWPAAARFQDSSKSVGQAMKDAGRSTKRAAKKSARDAKKGTKKAVHKSAKEVRKGSRKIEKKTKTKKHHSN